MIKLSKQEEKEMLKSNKMIRSFRLFFFNFFEASPLWVEQWLNEMQQKGYSLYKITPLRVAYFIKTEKVERFAVDYQRVCSNEYQNHHQECGWTLVSSRSGLIVWSQEYQPNTEPPTFFSEPQSKLELLRRMLKIVVSLSVIFALVFLATFIVSASIRGTGWDYVESTALILFALELVTVSVLLTVYSLEKQRATNGTVTAKQVSKRFFLLNLALYGLFAISSVIVAFATAETEIVNGEEIVSIAQTDFAKNIFACSFVMSAFLFISLFVSLAFFIKYSIKNKQKAR